MASGQSGKSDTRGAGATLIAGGLLVIVLMAQHPTGASGGAAIRGIHGALLLVVLAIATGFALFVRWRGSDLAIAGLVPYVAGVVAAAGAGTINGFVTPSLTERGIAGFGDLLWISNQVLATMGVIVTGIAYLVWAADLWRIKWRATAAAGALSGVLPAALLLTGQVEMGLMGALLAYATNALWAAWLGVMLWRRSGEAG